MTDINIAFSRAVLSNIHADVKKAFPNIKVLGDAWVWNAGRDTWEFHGPEGYYWFGRASNAYEARSNGWSAYLRSKGVEGYADADKGW